MSERVSEGEWVGAGDSLVTISPSLKARTHSLTRDHSSPLSVGKLY